MAGIARQAKRRAREHGDEVREQAPDQAATTLRPAAGLRAELTGAVREAAIEVFKPVMRKATTTAAKYAVTHAPSLIKDKVEGAGGASALAKGAASKGSGIAASVSGAAARLGDRANRNSPSGTGHGRRLPVEDSIDVGADIETAYDACSQFEEWPRFMHRVERIERRDHTTLMWHENIWGIRRSWEAQIIDQIPRERIAWRSTGGIGSQTMGVVTFHELSARLTRILITLDVQPQGLFEQTASATRITRRALKSDLIRLKAFVELHDGAGSAAPWRGTIQDGEVVDDPELRDDESQKTPRAPCPRVRTREGEALTVAVGTGVNRYAGGPTPSGLADVLDLILDKGLVIDLYVRVSLVGIELLTVDARIVVASVDTYLRFAEAVGRLNIDADDKQGLPELMESVVSGGAKSKTKGALDAVQEKVEGIFEGDDGTPARAERPRRRRTEEQR
jgi:uncharacterized membrane protein